VIPRSVRLSEAPSFGKSILEYASSGPAAQAYRALAREFMKRHAAPASPHESSHIPAPENRER
jgi:chromosome partitioning protein